MSNRTRTRFTPLAFPTETFATRLQELRQEHGGPSFDSLAADLGVDRRTVMRWFNDGEEPRTVHLLNLARRFRVSVDWLLEVKGAPKSWDHYPSDTANIAQAMEHAILREASEEIARTDVGDSSLQPRVLTAFYRLDGGKMFSALVQLVRDDIRTWQIQGGSYHAAVEFILNLQTLVRDAKHERSSLGGSPLASQLAQLGRTVDRMLLSPDNVQLRCFSPLSRSEVRRNLGLDPKPGVLRSVSTASHWLIETPLGQKVPDVAPSQEPNASPTE